MATQPLFFSIDSPRMRSAGRDVLSLALMDARNHSLHLAGQIERMLPDLLLPKGSAAQTPPLWLLGHMGWFGEWWIGRNTQRTSGSQCPPQPTRLASIEPRADVCFHPGLAPRAERALLQYPSLGDVKAYLLATLESTLELLEKTPDNDEALYFFRLALFREDQLGEQLCVMAQSLGVKLDFEPTRPYAPREPLLIPATRWALGHSPHSGGFAWDNELCASSVAVPEFEIDAQPVSWAQYVEFVDDGGYDDAAHWSASGWAWLQKLSAGEGRRGPRFVEQIGVASGAVMQTRFGQTQRSAGQSSALHVTWFEADAFARWAGRRLPSEVEWELAASKANGMGFRWGDVWEWTASTFRPYDSGGGESAKSFKSAFKPAPWADYSADAFERCKVLRGASFATRARMKVTSFRGFAPPQHDAGFYGFRTCAI